MTGSDELRAAHLAVWPAVQMAATLARHLDPDRIQAAIEAHGRWDAIGPIIDPTAWQQTRKDAARTERVLRAFSAFARVVSEEVDRE